MSAHQRTPFRLIDPPANPPPDVQERTRLFAAKVKWTFASTMPQWPHCYIVRAKTPRGLRGGYDRLWQDCLEHGWRGRFGRTVHRYLSVDGRRYWSCDLVDCVAPAARVPCPRAHIGVGCVINRAENRDLPLEQLRFDVEGER